MRLNQAADFQMLAVSEAVKKLTDLYFEYTDIPDKARADTYHIAWAAYCELDYLVSWNFKHILSSVIKNVIHSINSTNGFSSPVLCTPEELLEELS